MQSKILLATLLVSFPNIIESCRTNSECNGGYCDGYTISKSGICKQLVNDGGNCLGNGDSNSCMSKRCICNTCGLQVTDGKNCAKHNDCKSGWCDGAITTECRGICRVKKNDYEACLLISLGLGDNISCSSGRCESVSAIKALCAPKNGFDFGTPCDDEIDCDKSKNLYCNNSNAYVSGFCSKCPSECSNGCFSDFNQTGLTKCGQRTKYAEAADEARKLSGPIFDFFNCPSRRTRFLDGCAGEALVGLSSCLSSKEACKIKLGGEGSTCLALTNNGLSYNYSDGPLSFSGSVKPIGGLSVDADITNGKIEVALYGRLSVKADIVFETKASETMSYNRKLFLSDSNGLPCSTPTSEVSCRPFVLYTKTLVVGYIPIILQLKIQAVAEIDVNLKAEGSFKAGLSYENDAIVSIKKAVATFDPVKGVELDVGFNKDFSKTINKTLIVNAGVNLKGVVRIGAEITLAINGIPITIYPAARLVAEGDVQVNSSGCLTGSFSGGIGLDCGIRIGFKIPSPGKLFGDACRELVDATCKFSSSWQLTCSLKSLIGWDACTGLRNGCKKLEECITKVTPKSLGNAFSGGATIITTTFASFRPAGMTYCVGGLKPFLTQTADVMQTKLQGGGGGSGIATCDAPGADCNEDGEKGGGNSSKVNIAVVLLGIFLGLMTGITALLIWKLIQMKRAS